LPEDTSPFYKQLLYYWYEMYSSDVKNANDNKSEYIWYNKRILVANRPLFDKNAYNNGLLFINDRLDNNGNFLDLHTLTVAFQLRWNVMRHNSLKDGIQVVWKKKIKGTERIMVTPNEHVYIHMNDVPRDIKKT